MPTITDWLMVVITTIYVVATVFISCANIKSANVTREQLAESIRQYEDKKRLEIMPYIQFEQTNDSANHDLNLVLNSGSNLKGTYIFLMRMKNIGNGTAKDITYTYQWDNDAQSYDRGAFPIQALSSGESQTIRAEFSYSTDNRDIWEACFFLRYMDLLENAYTQVLNLRFTRSKSTTLKLAAFTTSAPTLMPKEETNV